MSVRSDGKKLWFSRLIAGLILLFGIVTVSAAQFKSVDHTLSLTETRARTYSTATKNTPTRSPSADRYWIAAAEVIGSDAASWAYFRYIHGDYWARIDIHSIKRNLKNGFWWDEDAFMGNQFNHPYHGSSYFNAARVNGLTFWESAPYALVGSAIWEFFLETEAPSTNDIVNTPVSGIILGEISYRITDLILDDSKSGMDRILRESSSFILNPMRGFNRLIHGELWQIGSSPTRPDYAMWLSVGGNNVFRNRTLTRNHSYGLASFDIEYGDLLATSSHEDPFDYFSVHAEYSFSKTDNILGILASGVLWDGKVKLFDKNSSVLGIYKEFHLLNNLVYHLTATSVASGLTNIVSLSPTTTLQSSFSFAAILMGGVNSQHAELFGKQYNIGPGASATLELLLNIGGFGNIHLNYKRYWLHTLNGAKSEEFVGLMNVGTHYRLNDATVLGLELLLYDRQGDYQQLPTITDSNSAVRLYARFLMS